MISFIRRFISGKKNVPGELYQEALRNENSGEFETALVTYERALGEANKAGFAGNSFKTMIIEKLKILRTVIEYKNGFIPEGK